MNKRMRVGGELERSLANNYRFDVKAVLLEGWAITRRSGLGLFVGILGVFSIWFLLTNLLLIPLFNDESSLAYLLPVSLAITVLISPLSSALDMLGLQQALGMRAKAVQIFDFFRYFVRLAVLSLLGTLLSACFGPLFALFNLPPLLALLPSSLITMGLLFSVPLLLERGFLPLRAIVTSLKIFWRGGNSIILLHLIFSLLFVLSVLSMGLGFIWVAPLYFNVRGILYRDLCGVSVEVKEGDSTTPPSSSDSFIA